MSSGTVPKPGSVDNPIGRSDTAHVPETAPTPATLTAIPYGRLKAKHECYKPNKWKCLRALYTGGSAIFDDKEVMRELFPAHNAEDPEVYEERCKRAHYENYAGTVVGHIVDALFQDEARLKREPEGTEGDYYEEFWEDSSPPGGERCSWNQTLRHQVVEAFQTGVAWTLIDLPDVGPEFRPANAAEEEKAGVLDAHAVPVPAEEVCNWKLDNNDELDWVLTCKCERVRDSIMDDGSLIRETYHYYTRTNWARFVIEYHDKDAKIDGERKKQPEDNDVIQAVDGAAHAFGKVPLRRIDFCPELWALDQLERVLKAHFNMTSGLDWAVDRANFPQLYEYLAPELPGLNTPVGEHQTDVHRATRQRRGIGYVQERGHQDKAEYVVPPTEAFAFTQSRLDSLRDEIYRVLYLMALSVDNSAASLRRTAESKSQDKAAMMVVLQGIGKLLRAHTMDCLELIATGRGEKIEFQVQGFEKFDPIALAEALENAVVVDTISIPSPTFHRVHKKSLARRVLAGDAEDADLDQIDKEIEANVLDEQFDPVAIEEKQREMLDAQDAKEEGGGKPKPGEKAGGGKSAGGRAPGRPAQLS